MGEEHAEDLVYPTMVDLSQDGPGPGDRLWRAAQLFDRRARSFAWTIMRIKEVGSGDSRGPEHWDFPEYAEQIAALRRTTGKDISVPEDPRPFSPWPPLIDEVRQTWPMFWSARTRVLRVVGEMIEAEESKQRVWITDRLMVVVGSVAEATRALPILSRIEPRDTEEGDQYLRHGGAFIPDPRRFRLLRSLSRMLVTVDELTMAPEFRVSQVTFRTRPS